MSKYVSYAEKLKDPRWQKRRLEILERDGWSCRQCESKTESLQVHHLRYSKEPWDTKSEHLVTLCEECHKKVQCLWDKMIDLICDHVGSGVCEPIYMIDDCTHWLQLTGDGPASALHVSQAEAYIHEILWKVRLGGSLSNAV